MISSNDIDLTPKALFELARRLETRLIRRGPQQAPYLWRAYLGGNGALSSEIGGFLHRFVSSDDLGERHCHPWLWSVSFILDGVYEEYRSKGRLVVAPDGTASTILGNDGSKRFSSGMRNFILADTFHQVNLVTRDAWTLFIHGPRVQEWGFAPTDRYGEVLPVRLIKKKTYDRLSVEKMEGDT